MHIAIISPAAERIPPLLYGGTGRVVHALTEGLLEIGHEVTLFATGDSETSATLKYLHPRRAWGDLADDFHANFAFRQAAEFDVIHDHTPTGAGVKYSQLINTLSLTTIHNSPQKNTRTIYKHFTDHSFVSVSNSQQKLFPETNFVSTIYNGVNTREFTLCEHKDEYLLHIGTISPRKGSHIAVEIAKRLHQCLKLAGRIEDKVFFERAIKPHLEEGQIEYVGEVGGQERVELFKHAKLLLFPITWSEPFGLVMIEAMACGTPVVAFNQGSVPEVLVHRKTGFIVSSLEEMCTAVCDIKMLRPEDCRKHVVANFSNEKMVRNYESLYKKLLAQK